MIRRLFLFLPTLLYGQGPTPTQKTATISGATVLDNYKIEWRPDPDNSRKLILLTTRVAPDNVTDLIITLGRRGYRWGDPAHDLMRFTTIVQTIIGDDGILHMSDPIDIPIEDLALIRIRGVQTTFESKVHKTEHPAAGR